MVQFKRDPLPIDRCQKHILEILRTFKNNIIFIGETGSGKSTQIPQFCYKAGLTKNGLLGITQPRRVAAKTLAERVALEMGTQIGDLVGYKFRFENELGKNTQIIYQTEGILLREALNDCRLRRYSVIIVDEVHERTINTDVLLYVLKQAQRERKKAKEAPLRLILMSATMNIQQLQSYLHRPQVYCIRGRQHKVQLFHGNDLKAQENDYLFNAIATVLQLHEIEPKDHGFLVFLTGQEEIDTAIRVIQKTRKTENQYADITLIPLYAAIPQQQQKQVFEPVPEGHRKVVFATNIAETSITIPGIRVIIDSGKVKRRSYDPKKRMDLLQVENISKAQAIQRAGRAGREAPGKCYRLYSQEDYETFDAMQVPEFLRSNITSVLLNLINLGMCALPTLSKLIDPPDNDQLQSAVHELIQLKAIELHCDGLHVNATDEGEKLSQFPIEPAHAKILLAASKLSCLEEALTVVAFLSSEPVFQQGNHDLFCKLDDGEYGQEAEAGSSDSLTKLSTNDGDHVRLVKIFQAFQTNRQLKGKNNMEDFFVNFGLNESRMEKIAQVRKQLHQICREVGEKSKGTKMKFTSCGNNYRPLRQAIYKGLFQNVCIYDPSAKCYWLGNKPTGSIRVRIHPSSCMVNQKMQAFVFTELIHTNEVYARDICPIQKEWISENNAALNSSFKKENGSILSGLERIQQLQLVRSSPSSSVSSSTSSNSVKRKKKGKRMLQMKENGEEKQENEDKDEEMEVGRDSATPMDVQEQMEEKMTLGGPKKSEGKWENTLMEIDNNAAPDEKEEEEKSALKKNNSTEKQQQRNGVKRKCPAGDNERPVNGAKKNGNKKKSPGTSTALSPGKHLVDYVVSSDSEEEEEGGEG